jgi:S1-C subfamily serine protease
MRYLVLLLGMLCAQPLAAQEVCEGDRRPRPDLDIGVLEVTTLISDVRHLVGAAAHSLYQSRLRATSPTPAASVVDTARLAYQRFGSEPIVRQVSRGAADGRLQAGDVITAIDGQLITTATGTHLLIDPPLDRDVRIRVRRGSSEWTVPVRARLSCRDRLDGVVQRGADGTLQPVSTEAGRADDHLVRRGTGDSVTWLFLARSLEVHAVPWLGLRFDCTRCTMVREDGRERWTFAEPPAINEISRGDPADRAGVRRGDILLAIDGHAITSTEAHGRLAGVQAGQTLRLRISRNGTERDILVTAIELRFVRGR